MVAVRQKTKASIWRQGEWVTNSHFGNACNPLKTPDADGLAWPGLDLFGQIWTGIRRMCFGEALKKQKR